MKGKKGGLGAFCYLAVFAMALLALPALLWFCRRGAGEEVALPVVMYHRVGESAADEYTVSPRQLEDDLEALLAALDGMCGALLAEYGSMPVLFAGGVMSNSILRRALTEKYGAVFAEPAFSADNAAGAAVLAARKEGVL